MRYLFILLSLVFISCDNKNKMSPTLKELYFSKDEIQECLPFYLTYLRLNQQEVIKEPEIMGGISILRTRNEDVCTCFVLFPIVMPDSYPYETLELSYITEASKEIQKATFEWRPLHQKDVRCGDAKLNFPNSDEKDLTFSKLYLSLDGRKWYSYLVLDHGLGMEMMRTSPIPMPVDSNTGLPIPLLESLKAQ